MNLFRLRLISYVFACALLLSFSPLTLSAAQSGSKASAASGGKIDLNTASPKDLDSLPGVGAATAKKIIAGRPYSSVDDLKKAGVPPATISKITPLVTVSGGSAAAAPASAPAKSAPAAAAPASAPAKSASAPPAAAPVAAPAPAKSATAAASQGTPGNGNVWVNLETGVYHYSTSRYYGKTKNGKYMPESDAIKAGYHAAKNEKKGQ